MTVNATGSATANIAGTTQASFTINSDNSTTSENSSLNFERGTGANAQIYWNETSDRFDVQLEGSSLVPIKCSNVLCGTTNKVGVSSSGNNLVLNVASGGSVIIQVI